MLTFFLAAVLFAQSPDPSVSSAAKQGPAVHEVVVTASARQQDPLEAPWSTALLGWQDLSAARSFSEALRALPSVMVQQTAHGQSSPYVRGLTGYHNLLLIDGIRLNHSAFRAGPNQYWSTVDPLTIEQVELVRGPSSVLYGSDAVGGTVNALSVRAPRGTAASGFQSSGALHTRWASAEKSLTTRGSLIFSNDDAWSLVAGYTVGDFGDLRAGHPTGLQPVTGYDERDGDFRLERWLSNGVVLTVGAQSVRQLEVPRTHQTIYGIPFHGTTPGSDLLRTHDQSRTLVYARAGWDHGGGSFDRGELTFSLHRHDEERQRERDQSGQLRRELQGFTVNDWGLTARFGTSGGWDWGGEMHHELIDSFKREWLDGVEQPGFIQGPVGDDATVDTVAVYLQREIQWQDFSLVPGLRLTHASISADRVVDPDSGNLTSLNRSWDALTGSLRAIWWTGNDSNIFAGLSQGFRNPSLYDLTSLDETSVEESPEFDLSPEHFLQAECGLKGRGHELAWQVSAWRTWIQGMIMRSPEDSTGSKVGKDNSNGWMHGIEVDLEWAFAPQWTATMMASWMNGEIEQRVGVDGVPFNQLAVVMAPVDRLMPLQAWLSARNTGSDGRFWYEGWLWSLGDADKLSFRDRRDGSRIPAGGTPGFTILGISAGWHLSSKLDFSLQLENLTDQDYRVHGSGINGAGRNLVAVIDLRF